VADVLLAQERLARLAEKRRDGLQGKRVAFMALNGYDYIGTVLVLSFSIWIELAANEMK
jgi:hypothetical protein